MYNGAKVTLAGHVAKDPRYSLVNGSTPKVTMRVAWTTRIQDRVTGEWRDGSTSFASVECWRSLASNVAASLRKGNAVVVTGGLRVREFEDREGRRRTTVDIDADSIGHDLSRGVTHLLPSLRRRDGDGRPDGLASGEAIRSGQEDAAAAGDDPGASEDVFDTDAVAQLAATTEEPGAEEPAVADEAAVAAAAF